MYCKNCGEIIDDNAAVCPKCGVVVDPGKLQPQTQSQNNAKRTNWIAVVGFILSFFTALIGMIVSIVGLKKAPEYDGNGKGLATAGIIIGAVTMVLYIIFYAVLFASAGSRLM